MFYTVTLFLVNPDEILFRSQPMYNRRPPARYTFDNQMIDMYAQMQPKMAHQGYAHLLFGPNRLQQKPVSTVD